MEKEEERRGYRTLRAWQKADELATAVFQAFGRSEKIPRWLSEQICKAAVSVPANIAEGYSRGSIGDYLRFLDIARGSLGETEYYVEFLGKNGLVPGPVVEVLSTLINDTGRLLFALIKSLAQKQKAGTWDRHYSTREERESYRVRAEEHVPVEILMSGRPPLHQASEGISLNNPQHRSYQRAQDLRQQAVSVMRELNPLSDHMVMGIKNSYRPDNGDAASAIQAIFTALEGVVYLNDGQIKEVHYQETEDGRDGYSVVLYLRPAFS